MLNTTKNTKKTSENKDLEVKLLTEAELMEEFNQTKVEPLNFTRKTLLDSSECLSYL